MTGHDHDETGRESEALEGFFEAARAHGTAPGAAFLERVHADALAAQPRPRPLAPAPRARGGWLAALGGWPALTGLATATVAGLWIGVADPATVGDLAFGGLDSGYDFSGFMGGYALGLDDG